MLGVGAPPTVIQGDGMVSESKTAIFLGVSLQVKDICCGISLGYVSLHDKDPFHPDAPNKTETIVGSWWFPPFCANARSNL